LRDLGLNSHPSQSNSVLVTDVPGGGHAFAEKILRSGVIVRPMAVFGEPDAIRVTVGTRELNERLLKAVSEILNVVQES
jgi:histidinol-phosphate aminotransferase